jgi:hypothetical protein
MNELELPGLLDSVEARSRSLLSVLTDPMLLLKAQDYDPSRFLRNAVHRDGAKLLYDDPQSAVLSSDSTKATARFVVSTIAKDRMGDAVVPQGCKTHLASYRANPVVFFGHKSYAFPIGSAWDEAKNLAVEVEDDVRVVSTVKFHLKTLESEQVFALVHADELRTASVGFLPKKAKVFRQKDDESRPRDQANFDPWVSFRFEEWELLEWSIVGVPANADCVAMRLSKGIDGKRLAEPIFNTFKSLAPPPLVWANGFDFPRGTTKSGDGTSASPVPPPTGPSDPPTGGASPPEEADPEFQLREFADLLKSHHDARESRQAEEDAQLGELLELTRALHARQEAIAESFFELTGRRV